MTKEELIKRLTHLVEGHDNKDSLVSWWKQHADELKLLLSSGQWLKLKPLNHGFEWLVVLHSQKGAMEILKSAGVEVIASSYYQEQYLQELYGFVIKNKPNHKAKAKELKRIYPQVFSAYPKFAHMLSIVFSDNDQLKPGASLEKIRQQEGALGIDMPPMLKEFFLNISAIQIGDALTISLDDLYLLKLNNISYCVLGEFCGSSKNPVGSLSKTTLMVYTAMVIYS